MDPNKTLSEIRDALAIMNSDNMSGQINAAASLAEHAEALDGWLSKGGFLPDAWRQPLVPAFGVNPLVDDMLHTVFTTALEGGIGYWAASSSYHWSNVVDGERVDDLEGFFSDVEDCEGDGSEDDAFKPGRIDRATVARGFELVAAGPIEGMNEVSRGKFLVMLTGRVAGMGDDRVDIDFDAGDADMLVQAGFLGRVVFG